MEDGLPVSAFSHVFISQVRKMLAGDLFVFEFLISFLKMFFLGKQIIARAVPLANYHSMFPQAVTMTKPLQPSSV